MSEFPFIVVEGIDGSGKSAVCRILAERIGAKLIVTPTEPINQARQYFDTCGDPLARFFYYMGALVLASHDIKAALQTQPVVCDRYIDTTIIYHEEMGANLGMFDFTKNPIVHPDKTFCLTVNEEIRFQRIIRRGNISTTDVKTELLSRVNARLIQKYPDFIDTSFLSVQEVTSVILNRI